MSTVCELVYHKELNLFNCFCGYMGLFHHCTRKIGGFIKTASCPTNCKLCEKEVNRKEYNSLQWKTNPDGYAICGSCYDKLGDNPICTDCFCSSFYSSLSEKCSCFKN